MVQISSVEAVEQAASAMEQCRAWVEAEPACWLDVRYAFGEAVATLRRAAARGDRRATALLAAGPVGIAHGLMAVLLEPAAAAELSAETRTLLLSQVEGLLQLSLEALDNSQARYYLGLLRADVEGRHQEAVEHYEAAVALALAHNPSDVAGASALRELQDLSAEGKVVSETVSRFAALKAARAE